MRRRYDLEASTNVLLGRRVYPTTLGWRGDRADEIAVLVHITDLTLCERWFPLALFVDGVDSEATVGEATARPGEGVSAGFVELKPTVTAPVMLLPETAVGQFLAEVEDWAAQLEQIRAAA